MPAFWAVDSQVVCPFRGVISETLPEATWAPGEPNGSEPVPSLSGAALPAAQSETWAGGRELGALLEGPAQTDRKFVHARIALGGARVRLV